MIPRRERNARFPTILPDCYTATSQVWDYRSCSRMEIALRNSVARLRRSRALIYGLWLIAGPSLAQQDIEPGHSIGKVSTQGDLIVMQLHDGALGRANLFDLTGRTLRFLPEGSRYRIENSPLFWDSDYGPLLTGAEVTLHQTAFPFSRKLWRSFLVGRNGSIRFGLSGKDIPLDPYGHPDGGIVLERFDQLAEVAGRLVDKTPAICVFLKPRMSGPRYVKELSDRVVITWELTEPFGSILDFTWFPTVNLFQVVLHHDGSIEMSYKDLSARDAIVGIYPAPSGTARPTLIHFSSVSRKDGPFRAAYEAFHYLAVPRPQDLVCTVIQALGDKFDFLAYYSDFRVDNQEASTPSDGPVGGHVTGIGDTRHDQSAAALKSRCTRGGYQLGFAQPVYAGSNEAQEEPPDGVPVGNTHDITFYAHQLKGRSGNSYPYNYAVGHLGHEIGHRWSAYASAEVNGKKISLGSWPHWASGLQAPVAFPYSLPVEASTLGGGVWQDNSDGTFTELRDGYFVPATGYSYLDLYLMGLMTAADVPDFFLLSKLVPSGKDLQGHPVFKAQRIKVTIRDLIAAEGPRLPDFDHSQRTFNTGFVVVVEHGKSPSRDLIERANGIRQQWIEYWKTTTGQRASMISRPR